MRAPRVHHVHNNIIFINVLPATISLRPFTAPCALHTLRPQAPALPVNTKNTLLPVEESVSSFDHKTSPMPLFSSNSVIRFVPFFCFVF